MRFRSNQSSFKLDRRFVKFEALLLALAIALTVASSRTQADTGTCSGQTITLPFTDVTGNPFFCFIAQLYFQGVTLGTSPTTYGPAQNVTREQMGAFLARTQNSTLQRGSRRAALNQFWTTKPTYTVTQGTGMLGTTAVGNSPQLVASDGADLWVANRNSASVSRVRASDGRLLETWTGATNATGVLAAMGRVFVTGNNSLYVIDPSQAPGAVTTLISDLVYDAQGIAFDGQRIWTANTSSVSIITPGSPFTVTDVYVSGTTFFSGILYDGNNIWVTHHPNNSAPSLIKKLDANGAVIDTATVGPVPGYPVYDGTNIWVPSFNYDSVTVVRATDAKVLATLTGNGLTNPISAAFDGQRILVTNFNTQTVSLFRAADFAPLGSFSTGAGSNPFGACSDGLNFWITLQGANKLARF